MVQFCLYIFNFRKHFSLLATSEKFCHFVHTLFFLEAVQSACISMVYKKAGKTNTWHVGLQTLALPWVDSTNQLLHSFLLRLFAGLAPSCTDVLGLGS